MLHSTMTSLITKKVLNLTKIVNNVNNSSKRLSSHFIYHPDNDKPVEGMFNLKENEM